MFLFEGNAVVINIRAEMRNQKRYPLVLATAMLSMLLIFSVFAFFAYYVFRGEANPIFTLNLVPMNGLVAFVLCCLSFNTFISYPLQILVAFDIIE